MKYIFFPILLMFWYVGVQALSFVFEFKFHETTFKSLLNEYTKE